MKYSSTLEMPVTPAGIKSADPVIEGLNSPILMGSRARGDVVAEALCYRTDDQGFKPR
jgi:hypothetical protein